MKQIYYKKPGGSEHNKHSVRLCGCNECYNTVQDGESHEQGRVLEVAECSQLEKHKSSRSKET